MNMTVDDTNGITRIILDGQLDIKGAQAIEVQFTAIATHHDRVIVDLNTVDYIASMGIRLLVLAGKAIARRSGKLVMFGASDAVAKVLTTSGVTEIIPLLDSWDAAVAAT